MTTDKRRSLAKPKKSQNDTNRKYLKPSSNYNESEVESSKFKYFIIFLTAIIIGVINRYHIAGMFENDRHFSYLSDMEREMTFRTEMGLYYSYFKTLVNAPSFTHGLDLIVNDNVTEYGHTINTLKRFNLYPELVLASMYKTYILVADLMKLQTQECWKTERGEGLEPVSSCEGMGNQFYFYINHVFFLNGLAASLLFLYGVLISDSIVGGLITTASFFFNHGEATRVQWTPPLRESLGYPFCLALMLIMTYMLKFQKSGGKWSALIALTTVCFMVSWQFASFVLSTQVGCVFVIYCFGYAASDCLRTISRGLLIGLFFAFCFLFGNEMILTSLFLSSLITLQIILSAENILKFLKFKILIIVCQIVTFAVGTLFIKFFIGRLLNVKDDAHIFDILKSKFTNYTDFHTQLYTCAAEFDFMLPETPWKLCQTLLLPTAFVAVILAFIHFLCIEFGNFKNIVVKPFGYIFYNVLQLAIFSIMAIIIMRLKLFFTPHLCIIASLIACRKIIGDCLGAKISASMQQGLAILLIGGMAVQGWQNIQQQLAIMGEYSNPNQERLFQWIEAETEPNAVFAGTMPTMANVKLSTERAIVNHPHYEDAALRERTVKVYSMFSRRSHEEVYKLLKDLGVQFYIFEYGWCQKSGRLGCSMPELFDLIDLDKRNNTALCQTIQSGDYGPFTLVYTNAYYKVFKI